jgi:hypothetical protein
MKRIFEKSGYSFVDPTETSEPITSIKYITDKINEGAFDDFINGNEALDDLIQELKDTDDGAVERFSSSAVRALYAHQLFDVGHRASNIKKSIAKLVKGFGKSCAIIFQKIVSIGEVLSLEDRICVCRAYPFHTYLNRHELCSANCKHNDTNSAKFNLDDKTDRIKFCKIMLYFYELSWVIHCYQYKRRTQKLESNHRKMLTWAPKAIDFKYSYKGRVDLSLAVGNDGPIALIKTMEHAGSECDDIVMMEMDKLTRRKMSRKNQSQYKIDRKKWDLGISTIHAVVHSWKYKDNDGLSKAQKKIIAKRKLGDVTSDSPSVLPAKRVKKSHDNKCTGGSCAEKHLNAKSKRRVIHKNCTKLLCAQC